MQRVSTDVLTGRVLRIGMSQRTGKNYLAIKTPVGYETGGSLELRADSPISEQELMDDIAKYIDASVTIAIVELGSWPDRSRTVVSIRPAEEKAG